MAKTTKNKKTSTRPILSPEPEFAGGCAARYIETSALLAARLEGDRNAWLSIRGEGVRFTSALTVAEYTRRVVRARLVGQFNDHQQRAALDWLRQFVRRCHVVDITADVLAGMGRHYPIEPVRALDAIHLATLQLWHDAPALVTVVTRDRRVADNARAMGYVVE